MGHGIAQSFLLGGYPVSLYDIQEFTLETARAHIERNLGLFQQANLTKSGNGFYDYASDFSKKDLNEVVRKRDREFLQRLKSLYLSTNE